MVRDILPDDKELAAGVEDQIKKRRLTDQLAVIRNFKGITQDQVATELSCTQGRISKLESGHDEDVTVGELTAYAKLAECNLAIVFENQHISLAEKIKHHAMCIKQCFAEMHELVQADQTIGAGVAAFHLEALINLVNIVGDASVKLHRHREAAEPKVTLKLQELCDNFLAEKSLKKPHEAIPASC